MARKSRRVNNIRIISNLLPEDNSRDAREELYKAAAYVRLSSEDDNENQDSINNQTQYLYQYVNEHKELLLVDTYIDNGFTGTNFERPEFERLMSDIKTGRINCIVVKDLSRFGRNYLEAGLYIENIIPKLGAKLIAINDNFDSSRPEDVNSISVPLKNMINEYYARDASNKIKASQARRMLDPEKLPFGNVPFGYSKNEDGTKYIISEPYANIVKLIFSWASIGVSCYEIAKRLTLVGIDPPSKCVSEKLSRTDSTNWYEFTVKTILANPVYTGDIVNNKYKCSKIERSYHKKEKDKWIIHKGTHEPIISHELFERVSNRKKLKNRSDILIDHKNNRWFDGKVFCSKCSRAMLSVREKLGNSSNQFIEEYCCSKKEYLKKSCGQRVTEDSLRIIVGKQLDYQLSLIRSMSDKLKQIKQSPVGNAEISIDKRLSYASSLLEKNSAEKIKLYTDYSEGILPADDYRVLKEKNLKDKEDIKKRIDAMLIERKNIKAKAEELLTLIDSKDKPGQIKLSKEVVNQVIERISVADNNGIEVVFKTTGIIDDLMKEMTVNEDSDLFKALSSR